MVNPAVEQELHQQLGNLSPGQQRGVPGSALLSFAGAIDAADVAVVSRVAEEDCEQTSLQDWQP